MPNLKRFDKVVEFATQYGGETLVAMSEDYAKHKINDKLGTKKYSVVEMSKTGEPVDLASKSVQLSNLFNKELETRTGKTLEGTFMNDVGSYSSEPSVKHMATTLQKVMLDSMIPYYISATGLDMLAEMHFVDYGEVLEFEMKDDTLYNVSKMGRRQRNTKKQENKKTKVTISMDMYGLSTGTTLPKVIQGIDSIADDTALMAQSIAKKIYTMVLKEFFTKTDTFTDSKWVLQNYSEDTLLEKLENLTAYNGEKPVIVGNIIALKKLLPANASVRILLSDEFNTTRGYMSVWNGYTVIAFDTVRDDEETSGFLKFPSDKVYGISLSTKLVHVGIGYTHTVTDEIKSQYNLSADTTIAKEMGVELKTRRKVVKCAI